MTKGTISYQGDLWTGGLTPEIAKAAEETKRYALELIKEKTPVDTGRLKSEWQAQVQGKGILFRNNAPYSLYVEGGTRKMAGRHMLESSLPAIQAYFVQALAVQIGKKLAQRLTLELDKKLSTNTLQTGKLKASGFTPRLPTSTRKKLG